MYATGRDTEPLSVHIRRADGTEDPHGAKELSHPEPGFYLAGMKSYGPQRRSWP